LDAFFLLSYELPPPQLLTPILTNQITSQWCLLDIELGTFKYRPSDRGSRLNRQIAEDIIPDSVLSIAKRFRERALLDNIPLMTDTARSIW
jgi:hypothetical protein